MMSKEKPLVSICCQTYNHKDYITEALESFLMQKTNFSFEILLRDDASKDGTAEICKDYAAKYPDLINLLAYEENQWQKGISPFRDNVKRAKGKYIALCEGDDYWTDPYKLQKQVDFLEANPEYGMVHTDFDRYNIKTDKYQRNWLANSVNSNIKVLSGNILETLLTYKSLVWTGTVCLRTKFVKMKGYQDLMKNNFMSGDHPLWCWVAAHAKIKYFPESTAVRRTLLKSATKGIDFKTGLKFINSDYRVAQYFVKKFNLNYNILEIAEKKELTRSLYLLYEKHQSERFMKLYEKNKHRLGFEFHIRWFGLKYEPFNFLIKMIIELQNFLENNIGF